MHLRLMLLLLSVLVFITCTEAQLPDVCTQGSLADRPDFCSSKGGRRTLNTLLQRLLKNELTDMLNTKERGLGAMKETEALETRNDENENLEEEVRLLDLLLDLEDQNNIKK